jgi:5-methylthioadenosine/S-adenosylhomocysteine deaminase
MTASTSAPQTVDTILKSRWIIPVVPENRLYEDCALVIDKGVIIALLPQAEAIQRYQSTNTIELGHHLLIPGLVNAHGHAAMSLLRGFADDHPLHTWLNEHIWPTEKRWVDPEFVRDGTELAMAEMIKSGTTCFADMYFYPEAAAQACLDAGMRAQISFPIFDFATAWGSGPDEYFEKGLRLRDSYRNHHLITIAFGPHAPYTVSDAPLQKIAMLAQEMDMPVQIHLHETAQEVEQSLATHGKRPLQRLYDLGFLSPLVQCVHMTQINDDDIATLQASGAQIVHCPESNLKLASGFCPVQQLLDAEINVALGTDGAASNNDLDLFSELKTAALLAKAVAQDASALNAHSALRMATINGAKALGIDEKTGSLEVGKAADITAIDLSGLGMQPLYNPLSQLIYTHAGQQVTHVWVEGKPLLLERQLQTLNEHEILTKAHQWHKQIAV